MIVNAITSHSSRLLFKERDPTLSVCVRAPNSIPISFSLSLSLWVKRCHAHGRLLTHNKIKCIPEKKNRMFFDQNAVRQIHIFIQHKWINFKTFQTRALSPHSNCDRPNGFSKILIWIVDHMGRVPICHHSMSMAALYWNDCAQLYFPFICIRCAHADALRACSEQYFFSLIASSDHSTSDHQLWCYSSCFRHVLTSSLTAHHF